MLKLILNECIKIYKRNKIFVVILMAFVISALIIFGAYTSNQNMKEIRSIENRVDNLERYIDSEQERLKKNDMSSDQKKQIEENIQKQKKELEILKIEMKKDKELDWRETLESQKKAYLERNSEDIDENTKMQIDKINYYLDNNIEPKDNYSNDAFSIFLRAYNIMFILFIPIITVIAGADIVSSEFNPQTIKMLLIRPVEKYKILLSKYITLIMLTIMYIILTSAFIIIVAGIFGGFNGALEPVITNQDYTFVKSLQNGLEVTEHFLKENTYKIIPAWEYISYAVIYSIVANIVLASFSFFVSNIFRKSALNFIVTTGGILGGSIVLQIFHDSVITKYVFLNYLTIGPVWRGEMQIQYGDPNINILFTMILFGVTTLFFLISSVFLFTKREIKS